MNFKKIFLVGLIAALTVTGCASSDAKKEIDLNAVSLEDMVKKAKEEGEVNSVGMPDSWANWIQTWEEITAEYGIKHTDVDMSSAEELAVFEAEKDSPTKDIGDVGQSFGPLAEEKGLTLPYKTTNWDKIPDWAKDDDGDWIIGYYGTMAIITNKQLVQEAPKSFADLLKGDYKIAVGDVTKATQAQSAVLAAAIAMGGDETNIKPGIDFYKQLAEAGRLDKGELSLTRLEKGEIEVALLWDFNALGYKAQFEANNSNAQYEVHIPVDGSVQSGYATVINAYAPHPHAAALTREYILSDKGQINLARGFAKPIRSDVVLPEDVKSKMIPDEEYVKAVPIKDFKAWENTVKELGALWQEEVMASAK
jgi:putative spermidine/putrescine transport system substrate-binding protein